MNQCHVELVHGLIDVTPWQNQFADPESGAEAWFFGITREVTRLETGVQVTRSLFYDAHRPMAMAELERLADRAIAKFGLRRLVLIHRLGEVPAGQASVAVGCHSPHRKSCFEGLSWIMETLKAEVPIWKREQNDVGNTFWVHPERTT